MSNWTHVASVFRVDGVNYQLCDEEELDAVREEKSYEDFVRYVMEKYFGKEVLWESDETVWEDARKNPNDYLPRGSEGSLKMSIWINPNKSSMASYTVTIFGDLRDHDSVDSIIEWFKEKCKLFWIRNACCTVSNEWFGTKTISYVSEDKFLEVSSK